MIENIFNIYPYNLSFYLVSGFLKCNTNSVFIEQALCIDPFELDEMVRTAPCLNEREKEVIKLKFVDYNTYKQIADILHLTPCRVTQILKNARRKINHTPHLKDQYQTITKEKANGQIKATMNRVFGLSSNSALNEKWPIQDAELSPRAFNCLYRHGIRDVHELIGMSKTDVLRIRNFGDRSWKELMDRLSTKYNLKLNPETETIERT